MNTDKVFIVNTDQGPRVVTPGVVEKDIQSALQKDAPKVKAKDIASYAQDLTSELIGQAIDDASYKRHIEDATISLGAFATLTPYSFGVMLKQSKI